MELNTIVTLSILAILIILSGFFSGSETAIFSLTTLEREKLRRTTKGRSARFLKLITEKPDDLLITILTGNMIVNMFATVLYDRLVGDVVFIQNETIAFFSPIVSMTLILLLCGDLLPKSYAVRNPIPGVRLIAAPLSVIHILLFPIRIVLGRIKSLLTLRFPEEADERDLINATIEIGHKEGIINQLEYNIFESFFSFNTLTAQEVMLPRAAISGIEIATPIETVLVHCEQAERDAAHSLLLVYKENIDHPLGYIEIKDLVPFRYHLAGDKTLEDLLQPLHPVPQAKKLSQLLREMKEENTGMALVVDEYGGTAGVLTFKHLVESILSYFYASEEERIKKTGGNTYIVPGNLEVKTLLETLNLRYETESRTVGGLVLEELGEIPQEGADVTINNIRFTVVKMQQNRIHTLKVEVGV
jgi:putative hemolysin